MSETVKMRKKLIEVALPLEAINLACKADKDRKTGHIRNIHKWFAPMPLPALRAILVATLLDAPDERDELKNRIQLLTNLVQTGPEPPPPVSLTNARRLLREQLGSRKVWVLDPFCGGGSTLVEAQRLGLAAEGSDLNPIPVLISRCLTVYPRKYKGLPPITGGELLSAEHDLAGVIADIRNYGDRVCRAAAKSLGRLYPTAPNGDRVIYWWWAHTVPSPDPAFAHCRTPLVTSWWLSLRDGDHRYLVPTPNKKTGLIAFRIENKGTPQDTSKDRCLFSGSPITYKYVREQAEKGNLGTTLLAYVSDGDHGRNYWPADEKHSQAAELEAPSDLPTLPIPKDGLGISVQNYGIEEWPQLFTSRQQKTLSYFAHLIRQVPTWVQEDHGSEEYGNYIAQFLGLCLGKLSQASSKIVRLYVRKGPSPKAEPAFARGDIQLNWDFAETNPFGQSVGDWMQVVTTALRAYGLVDPSGADVITRQSDARQAGKEHPQHYVVITDPPYFSAIGYADLSEYFYYWLRIALRDTCPDLFATVGVPKISELIASPDRHGGRLQASEHFVTGFTETFSHLRNISAPDFPIVVVYAQRQEDQSRADGATTGWEAMLEAILRAGLGITGTWPVWGTGSARMRSHDSNALASYIVLVCRPKSETLGVGSRREFVSALRNELPLALSDLQGATIAPVDLAQAAIGPGMGIFSRYSRIANAEGSTLRVRDALVLINEAVDELLTHQEGDIDSITRWALGWFEQFGFETGEYGVAEQLSKAKNTSVSSMVEARILLSKAGNVRLLRPNELPNPEIIIKSGRLTHWARLHLMINLLTVGGEEAVAQFAQAIGSSAEISRDLSYRLYAICQRRKWTQEALTYNSLVESWPEIIRLAREASRSGRREATLFSESEE